MWERIEHRLALLELVSRAQLRSRQSQAEAFAWLAELPWTRLSTRRDELVLVENRRADLETLLANVWPEWRTVLAKLVDEGLQSTERDWRELLDRERAAALGALPDRLNLKTATAQVAPHSKASLTETNKRALERAGLDGLTRDGLVRLRPNAGLALARGARTASVVELSDLVGEVILPQRAFADGTALAGVLPHAIVVVENLGPFLDMAQPEGWLVAHVSGWDTHTVKILLDQTRGIPVLHFGDLDYNGLRIYEHLRETRADLRWFVPDFWSEYLDRALPKSWPEDVILDGAPPIVQDLARRGLWLEQETIALDPRILDALKRYDRT
jgi:hypothetical protein